MSEIEQIPAPQHSFAVPADIPPASNPVADRMARYSEVLQADPSQAPAIEQLVKHQLAMEAQIDREHPGGLGRGQISDDFLAAQAAHAQGDQFAQLLDKTMQPAASPSDYFLSANPSTADIPEVQQQEAGLRAAMFAAEMPRDTGNAIGQSLYEQSHRVNNMTPEQIDDQRGRTYDTLKAMWGAEYDGRAQRLQAFARDQYVRHPATAAALNAINLSPTALKVLSDWIEYRTTRKA